MLAGIAVGATLLVNLPRGPALLLLGIFVGVYGVHLLGGQREWKALHPGWAWPLGFAGGVFSVLFGTGGPIFMIFLAARIHDKSRLRATSSIVVTVSVSIRAAVFVATGLLAHAQILVFAGLLVPAMLAGYFLGNRLHHALSRARVIHLIAALLVANGALLVVRALALLRGTIERAGGGDAGARRAGAAGNHWPKAPCLSWTSDNVEQQEPACRPVNGPVGRIDEPAR